MTFTVPKFTGRELLWLVRGLAFVLGGLAVGVAGMVLSRMLVLTAWSGRPLLLVPAGAGLIWFGAAYLRRVTSPGEGWHHETSRCRAMAMAMTFLSPFAYFYHRAPDDAYLLVNLLLLVGSGVTLLCVIPRLVLRLAEHLGDDTLTVMAWVCRWFNYLALVAPLVVLASAAMSVAFREGRYLWSVVRDYLDLLPAWSDALALAPICLSGALLWTAKAIVLAQFEQVANGVPDGDSQPQRVGPQPH